MKKIKGVIFMLTTYLLIGLVVQIITTVERVIRGVVILDGVFDTPSNIAIFVITFIIGFIFNILIWPFSIICEIKNIIDGN